MHKSAQAHGRMKRGKMNTTETEYAQYLELRRHAGEIVWYKFEGMKFRLADNTFYTPDFAVMLASGELQCHEVKGFMMEDANVKIKVAADLYPISFFLIRAQKKKFGGGWKIQEVSR